jgi:hypothetical protein
MMDTCSITGIQAMEANTLFYSGTGMRDPEADASVVIAELAAQLSDLGATLRTAKSKGVDRLFKNSHSGQQQIITDKMVPPAEAFEIAARNHGAWHLCDERTQRIHAQNVLIHLGPDLDRHVVFNLVWSPAGPEYMGGSALGMRVCREFGIPFFNIRGAHGREAFRALLDTLAPGVQVPAAL